MQAIALIDVQNDFIDGSLGVGVGNFVYAWQAIEKLFAEEHFDYRIFTRDYHPADHCSFKENGGMWPAHCVAGTPGSDFYWKVKLYKQDGDLVIDKGCDKNQEEYGVDVLRDMADKDITTVYLVGLCTDYCVSESAIMTKQAHPDVDVIVVGNGCCWIEQNSLFKAMYRMQQAGVHTRQ